LDEECFDAMAIKTELTYAERRILRLLASDLTMREIGSELNFSVKAVRTHVHSIYRKLRVSSRMEAIDAARAGRSANPSSTAGPDRA
jgi:LuxR family maltose regulon positive regulatory protein